MKRFACMTTLVKKSKVTSIHSGSLLDSQSDLVQSDSGQEDSSPTKSDLESSQDDGSDNLEAEPEIPPSDPQKRQGKFNPEGIVQKIHKNQIHHLHYLNISSLTDFEVVEARTSLKDTRKREVLLYLSSRRTIDVQLTQGLKRL